jgi:pectate lyase
VYIDGVRVVSAYDSTLKHGHAGLRMYLARADYDNVVIAPGARRALFKSSFDASFDMNPIDRLSGSWSVVNIAGSSELAQSSTHVTARAIVGDVTDDQVLQTQLRIQSFGTGDAWAGLMARFVDIRNYYYVSVRAGGVISLRKLVGGAATVLGNVPFTVSSQPMYLRLEVVGTKLRVYVNDALLLERSDATLTRGSSGFITCETAASYDDYVAYQP